MPPTNARVPGLLLLAIPVLLAVGAWLVFASGDADAPPAPDAPPAAAPGDPTPAAPVREPVRTSPPPRPAVDEAPAPAPVPTPEPAPPASDANVVLSVRDLTTRLPVAAFRWQFRNSLGTQRGEGLAGRADLALPPSATGELLVEAPGLAPLVREGVIVPTPPAPALALDLFLGPEVAAAGITLHVRGLSLEPVQHVRVDAFALPKEAGARAWHLGQPLWARRTTATDGRYVLPPLPAGEYGIRVVATDADGTTLPLLPWLRTFVLTGDNGFVEDVPLEPGALLALDLTDADGQPYDPVRHGTAALDLRLPGGGPVARKWLVRGQGADAAAIDVLPGVGRVLLADAVLPGTYQLVVTVRGTPRAERLLVLRPGRLHEERLVVAH